MLVKLEDAIKILNEMFEEMYERNYKGVMKEGLMKLNSLPTYNPEQVLKDMIEEVKNPWKEWETIHKTSVLEEALSRITKQ